MSPKIPRLKFNAGAFGHTLVSRRAGRWLQEFLDGLGEERVIFVVQKDLAILDLIPSDLKIHYKRQAEEYRELLPSFENEEVYGWVPDYWQEIIESQDGGKEWGLRQVANIRAFALA